MSNSLSNIGLSGINAAQYGLTTTGQNISNATTPGYNRESALLHSADSQYTGSGYIGTGVDVETVKRSYSGALSSRLNAAQSTSSALSTYNTEAKSLNAIVGDPTLGVAANMTGFFAAAQSLSANPSDVASRSAVIGAAKTAVDSIHSSAEQMDAIRTSVNAQVTDTIGEINKAAQSIAKLNNQINAASATGQQPNSLLDERDRQLSTLSSLVNVNMTKQSDGSYSVFTGTGQPLVLGSNTFSLSAVPSPTDTSAVTVGYQGADGASASQEGGQKGYLSESTLTGGKLGGLLAFRSQMLDPAQDQLGKISASFAGAVNEQNAKGMDLSGKAGGPLFSLSAPVVNANHHNAGDAKLDASFKDPKALTGDNYVLAYDGKDYTLKNLRSGTVTEVSNWPATVDGVEYKLNGAMRAGDSFTITPTRAVGTSLALATTDGSAIAAATSVVAASGTHNRGTGAVALDSLDPAAGDGKGGNVSLTFRSETDPKTGAASNTLSGFPPNADVTVTHGSGSDAVTQTYKSPAKDVPFVEGEKLSFGGMSVTVSGRPKNGDTFTLSHNASTSGDGSNAVSMGNLQNASLVGGKNTLTQSYADYVDQVGSLASQTAVANTTQDTLVNQLKLQQQSVSGVNLDEEAANLMQYQQMYQANSKVIQTAGTLFDTILDMVK